MEKYLLTFWDNVKSSLAFILGLNIYLYFGIKIQ